MDKTVPIVKLTDLPVGTVINDQEHDSLRQIRRKTDDVR